MWYLWPHLVLIPYLASLLGLAIYGRRSPEHAAGSLRVVVAMGVTSTMALCAFNAVQAGGALHRMEIDAPAIEPSDPERLAFPISLQGAFIGAALPIGTALWRRAKRRSVVPP